VAAKFKNECPGTNGAPPSAAEGATAQSFNMKRAVTAFAAYVLLSVVLDAMIMLRLPYAKNIQDALVMTALLIIIQIAIALEVAKSMARGDEEYAITLAVLPPLMYFACAALALYAAGKLQWLSAAASQLASAAAAFATGAGPLALSAALALSLAAFASKLRGGDYGGAAWALFSAFASALLLILLTLL